MIAAYDRRRAIGKNGRIPWRIPGEQQRFRSLTLGQTVIFGRRTYEEIGVPLPGRENFIVSRTRQFTGAHLRTFPTLADAVAAAETEQVFLGAAQAFMRRAWRWRRRCTSRRSPGTFTETRFFRRCRQDSLHEPQRSATAVGFRMCM